jgi:cobyrinic acid a,c-diamide synthase
MTTSTGHARTLLVSAIASGQGKTTVTAALARKFMRAGQRVRVFKTGPDFLDPRMLAHACGAPVQTLDLWMVGEARCRALLAQAGREADVVLIEGVMGLYDGDPSSADLARAFDVPVLAVLDASAMAQTVGALAQGLRDYGPVHLAGVIANRIASPGHATMVARAMRGIPLLGTLPRQAQGLPERHLGLVLPQEVPDLDRTFDALADSLALDDEAWRAITPTQIDSTDGESVSSSPLLQGRVIAIARDAAFAFLYPANITCLEAMGTQVAWFSPLADEVVPSAANAVYLPGGYPELHAETLSRAQRWRASMRAAHARGVPLLAECGAMMALTGQLQDGAGRVWPMAGLLAGTVRMQARLAALGPQAWVNAHGELRGHTFHYSAFETPLQPLARTRKHPSGVDGEAIYRSGSLTASYFHAYFESCPSAVAAIFTGSDL